MREEVRVSAQAAGTVAVVAMAVAVADSQDSSCLFIIGMSWCNGSNITASTAAAAAAAAGVAVVIVLKVLV